MPQYDYGLRAFDDACVPVLLLVFHHINADRCSGTRYASEDLLHDKATVPKWTASRRNGIIVVVLCHSCVVRANGAQLRSQDDINSRLL